jgi:ribonucleoside-diphosphate reductase alpha chain
MMSSQALSVASDDATTRESDGHEGTQTAQVLSDPRESNHLHPLGEKIFLDRYALKESNKAAIEPGDLVLVCVDLKSGQREVGTVREIEDDGVTVELREGETVHRSFDYVDKPLELNPEQMLDRVAKGIAAVEIAGQREEWAARFRWLLYGWKFIPGGRILATAGTDQHLTHYNCFVIPSPADSRGGIIKTLAQMTEIMSRGGGVGINLSSLRPHYTHVRGVNGRSSGSVSWGALYSFATGLIEQGGSRRGALMLILNIWHPDIMEFIESKRVMGRITNANISVGVTDDFMEAVRADADWQLVFPVINHPTFDDTWDGDLDRWRADGKPVIVYKTVKARQIWDAIIESAWASAEPGVFFVDRYNKMSNSWYYARILCTNPCGEQGLPAWGVCNLGALNLGRFVSRGEVLWDDLRTATRYAVRFLDNVVDASPYYFDENRQRQQMERRVGLGTMGLAEMLIRLGLRYGSPEGVAFIDRLYRFLAVEAYLASADYAADKGSFPALDVEKFLQSGFMKAMPEEVHQAVRAKGIRNVTLLTQAPTGTTGTMVDTSTGIEPFYYWTYNRKSRLGVHQEKVSVLGEWLADHPDEPLPDYFVAAMDLQAEDHVRVQAAIQRWVDSSISKTCNVPKHYTIQQTRQLYEMMYDMGVKGGTIYRDGSRDEQVLQRTEPEREKPVEIKWRARPGVLRGYTYRKNTPIGTAYITINANGEGEKEPFELFVNVGKAGSDVAADAEGIGRLVSLILRMPSPLTPQQRVQDVVGQLRDIGSGRAQGFGKHRVQSLPDAVAQVLAEHIGLHEQEELPGLPEVEENAIQLPLPIKGDFCPECGQATLLHIEGCRKCYNCGYSEC